MISEVKQSSVSMMKTSMLVNISVDLEKDIEAKILFKIVKERLTMFYL